jgi:hypothetical protein
MEMGPWNRDGWTFYVKRSPQPPIFIHVHWVDFWVYRGIIPFFIFFGVGVNTKLPIQFKFCCNFEIHYFTIFLGEFLRGTGGGKPPTNNQCTPLPIFLRKSVVEISDRQKKYAKVALSTSKEKCK